MFGKYPRQKCRFGNVAVDKCVFRRSGQRAQVFEVSRVGQRIEIDHGFGVLRVVAFGLRRQWVLG